MIEGLIAGRLTGTPEDRTDRFGKLFMVARMRATANDGSSLFVNVVAFDPVPCAQLRELEEGDAVSLTGPMTPKVWTDRQGLNHAAMDVVAYRVLALPVKQAVQDYN